MKNLSRMRMPRSTDRPFTGQARKLAAVKPLAMESRAIDISQYDFLDFGCSTGGSMRFGQQRLGGKRGLGIDIDEQKVAATRMAGYDAECVDLTDPKRFSGKVRFTILSHFLEHFRT